MSNNPKLSFSPTSGYQRKNDFSEESFIEQAINSIYRIITTPLGSDFENPMYGCNLRTHIFSQATEDVLEAVEDSIYRAIDNFEPLYSSSIKVEAKWWQEKIIGAKKYIEINISFRGINGTLISLLANLNNGNIERQK